MDTYDCISTRGTWGQQVYSFHFSFISLPLSLSLLPSVSLSLFFSLPLFLSLIFCILYVSLWGMYPIKYWRPYLKGKGTFLSIYSNRIYSAFLSSFSSIYSLPTHSLATWNFQQFIFRKSYMLINTALYYNYYFIYIFNIQSRVDLAANTQIMEAQHSNNGGPALK